MNNRTVRIKDIAKLAGVSVGTVDRVLHNRGKVSEKSLQKVHAILKEIDYKPNLIARSLGLNKTFRIAALLPDPNLDPYWAQSFEGIKKSAGEWQQRGLVVEPFFYDLHNSKSFVKAANALTKSAPGGSPDGVIVAPLFYKEALPLFKTFYSLGIPYVLFNTRIEEAAPLSFIGQNLYQSGRLAAELSALGISKGGRVAILHVYEDLPNSVHLMEKEKGFKQFFKERPEMGIEVKSLHLASPEKPSFRDDLTNLFSDTLLQGVFISTSKAFQVVDILKKTGRKDIRIVGYDLLDENLAALKAGDIAFLINQNPARQAAIGIDHLANQLIFKLEPAAEYLLPLEIITQENIASYKHN